MDRETLLKEGIQTHFWREVCKALDERIESAKRHLETQTNIDRIRFLQYDIRVCREFKNLPNFLVKRAENESKAARKNKEER